MVSKSIRDWLSHYKVKIVLVFMLFLFLLSIVSNFFHKLYQNIFLCYIIILNNLLSSINSVFSFQFTQYAVSLLLNVFF